MSDKVRVRLATIMRPRLSRSRRIGADHGRLAGVTGVLSRSTRR